MNTRRASCRILVFSVVFALIAAVPHQLSAQAKQGVEFYGAGQFQEAESAFRDALRGNPSDAPNRYYLGLSVLLQDRFSEALDQFLKVRQTQVGAERPAVPDEYQINLAMARARLGLKQYTDAWKNLEQARIANPSADVFVYRGVYFLQQERYPEAIKELEKAMSLDAKNAYAFYYAGLAYYKTSQGEEAMDALKMFLQLYPDAPEAAKAREIIAKLC